MEISVEFFRKLLAIELEMGLGLGVPWTLPFLQKQTPKCPIVHVHVVPMIYLRLLWSQQMIPNLPRSWTWRTKLHLWASGPQCRKMLSLTSSSQRLPMLSTHPVKAAEAVESDKTGRKTRPSKLCETQNIQNISRHCVKSTHRRFPGSTHDGPSADMRHFFSDHKNHHISKWFLESRLLYHFHLVSISTMQDKRT